MAGVNRFRRLPKRDERRGGIYDAVTSLAAIRATSMSVAVIRIAPPADSAIATINRPRPGSSRSCTGLGAFRDRAADPGAMATSWGATWDAMGHASRPSIASRAGGPPWMPGAHG